MFFRINTYQQMEQAEINAAGKDPLAVMIPYVDTYVRPIFGGGPLVDNAHTIGFAVVLYASLYQASKLFLLNKPLRDTLATRKSQTDFCIRIVSFLQSVAICILGIPVLNSPDLPDHLFGSTPYTSFYVSMALGYFIYDAIISLYYVRMFGIGFAVHGLVSTAVFIAGLENDFIHYYSAAFLLFEASTPFLNVRWFGLKFGDAIPAWFQLANNVVLILVFFIARIAWGWYQLSCLVTDMYASVTDPRFPYFAATIILSCNMVLNVLNFYWFNKMLTVAVTTITSWLGKEHDAEKMKLM